MQRNVLVSLALAALPALVGCQREAATDQPAPAAELMGSKGPPGLPGSEPVIQLDENKKGTKPPPGGADAVVQLDENKTATKSPAGGTEPVIQLDENKKGTGSAKGASTALPGTDGINKKAPAATAPPAPTLPPPKDISK